MLPDYTYGRLLSMTVNNHQAEELQGANQVDGVADLITCDEETAAGVSGR